MGSEANSSGERLYKDTDGVKCNIRGMIRREPEWVASRFNTMEDMITALTQRAEAAEAVVEKFRERFTTKDGVFVTPKDTVYHAPWGLVEWVAEDFDPDNPYRVDRPNEDGDFVAIREDLVGSELNLNSGVQYDYEDVAYANDCYSSFDAMMEDAKKEYERLNKEHRDAYEAALAARGAEGVE